MNIFYHIAGRFYQARSERAARISARLKKKAETFFLRVKGVKGLAK